MMDNGSGGCESAMIQAGIQAAAVTFLKGTELETLNRRGLHKAHREYCTKYRQESA